MSPANAGSSSSAGFRTSPRSPPVQRDDEHVDALADVARHRRRALARLVVGVGVDGQQAERFAGVSRSRTPSVLRRATTRSRTPYQPTVGAHRVRTARTATPRPASHARYGDAPPRSRAGVALRSSARPRGAGRRGRASSGARVVRRRSTATVVGYDVDRQPGERRRRGHRTTAACPCAARSSPRTATRRSSARSRRPARRRARERRLVVLHERQNRGRHAARASAGVAGLHAGVPRREPPRHLVGSRRDARPQPCPAHPRSRHRDHLADPGGLRPAQAEYDQRPVRAARHRQAHRGGPRGGRPQGERRLPRGQGGAGEERGPDPPARASCSRTPRSARHPTADGRVVGPAGRHRRLSTGDQPQRFLLGRREAAGDATSTSTARRARSGRPSSVGRRRAGRLLAAQRPALISVEIESVEPYTG